MFFVLHFLGILLTNRHMRLAAAGSPSELQQTDMRVLYDHLFNGYQRELRPVLDENDPVNVKLKFWLKQILKVDERDQIVTVYCWLELYWRDETLSWDPIVFGNLTRIHVPADKVWKPDILVYNNANMNVGENELDTNAILEHDGRVLLFRSIITSISCQLNLANFPFDQQVCYLTFASWSMDGSKLMLIPTENTDNLELYIRNTEWSLTDFKAKSYFKRYECCPHPFPDITYFMVLRRSPSYYIFSLVIPSAFITVVTIVGFFTPHSTTGENTEKVSLGVTALLSMAIIMMMVSDEVPATSEVIPLIGKYYIGLIFLIFVAAFTTTLTLSFQMRGNSGEELPLPLRRFFFIHIAGNKFVSWAFSFQLPKKYVTRPEKEQTFIFENLRNCLNGYYRGFAKQNEQQNGGIGMDDLERKKRKIIMSNSAAQCAHLLSERLRVVVEDVRDIIQHERDSRRIQFEWQQVTRIIDRIIMFIYIVATITFAVYMLTTRDPDIWLTDHLMDTIKK
ncbi:unnamed protein product, partial [Mesorhabditis belari]|uniref:Uncharacterized protein n=1 Tax=Mesorhabditis belari TaxID=2138241 RepID=A0AAF3J3H3_9BILA